MRRRVLVGVLFVVLFGLGWWVGRGRATADLYANLDLFVEVLHKIEENYVDPVEPSRLIDGALKGMLKDLDPYSQYLDEKSFSSLEAMTHGRFSGIGAVVGMRDNYPTVISPIEGSPAWQAGLASGDAIVRVDGKPTAGISVEEAAGLLRGPEGTEVTVTVRREGESGEHEFTLKRREIVTKSVPYAFVLDGGVGYLRLANFSEQSGVEVRAAVERLRAAGAKSLVLDVRMNPGGLLDQAVDVAEQFLPEGSLVVYTRGRAQPQQNRYYASEPKAETRWPMVVLVDHGSASASEIVAGALQDRDRALVIGRVTFGKGSVQSVFPLRGQSAALKLTTALYYTPSGRSIHRAAHDSLDAGADDEAPAPEPGPAVTPPDSAARPAYLTEGGRRVYGGGGITPDVVVPGDSLPPLTARIEQRGLAFRFANRWVNTHPGGKASPGEPAWKDFVAFLESEKLVFDDAGLAREREPLDRALRRELARRLGGDSAAVRVVLAGDPVFERAIQVLSRARSARDVFAAARVEGGDAAPADRARLRESERADGAPRARSRGTSGGQGGGKRIRSSGS